MAFKHEQRIPPVLWTVVADRSRARVFSAPWPQADSWEEARYHTLINDLELIGKVSDCPPEIVAMVEKHVTQPVSH